MSLLTTSIIVRAKGSLVDIPAKSSPNELSTRLVYDGVNVIALFESTGFTWTRNVLFCATTEKECLDEITRLGLKTPVEKFVEFTG